MCELGVERVGWGVLRVLLVGHVATLRLLTTLGPIHAVTTRALPLLVGTRLFRMPCQTRPHGQTHARPAVILLVDALMTRATAADDSDLGW